MMKKNIDKKTFKNYKKMKSIKFVILIFFVITSQLLSQNLDFFDKIIGTWEGIYNAGLFQGDTIKNREQLKIQWILNKQYVQIDMTGSVVKYPDFKYEEKLLFTLGEDNYIIGWGFTESGYKSQIEFRGWAENNKLVLDEKGKNIKGKWILELKDGMLIRTCTGIIDNHESNVEAIYRKK
jgi:hypothetical protein